MRGLTISSSELCDDKAVINETVVRLLEEIRREMSRDIDWDRIFGINLDKLTVRQRNAIHNWVHNSFEDRLHRIGKNIKKESQNE